MDQIRALTPADAALLERATVENVNWEREQVTLADVRAARELAHYTWFSPDRGDFGVVVERDGEAAGVAWALFLPPDDPGYGFVADDVPEVALWVRSDARRQGLGRRLLRALKDAALARGVTRVSLSVEDGNNARHLYESEGFVDVAGREGDGVMVWQAR
ncbi:MAG: GNAT family N-acetyltransferase [Actinomycetales bacterium]|nr:GNAT family N-acetyltransferase [Actinomycetales bacterium]